MHAEFGPGRLELVVGDICRQAVDAVVNAANSRLAGGGGVDGAIHRAGGPSIMAETRQRYPDGCPTGSAVITTAGDLPATHVIHAVGPVWRGGDRGEPEQLSAAYRASFALAEQHALASIAFPALSAGAYGYPLADAARVALSAVAASLQSAASVRLSRFVLFDEATFEVFSQSLQDL